MGKPGFAAGRGGLCCVPMQTHLRPIAAVALAAALLAPAVADEHASPVEEIAALRQQVVALEARVAALEAEAADRRAGGQAVARVATIADRALARLTDMMRGLRGGAEP